MFSIFYIPHKHLLQVYPNQSNPVQYCTEPCKSHCYCCDSLSTNSWIKMACTVSRNHPPCVSFVTDNRRNAGGRPMCSSGASAGTSPPSGEFHVSAHQNSKCKLFKIPANNVNIRCCLSPKVGVWYTIKTNTHSREMYKQLMELHISTTLKDLGFGMYFRCYRSKFIHWL